MNNKKLKTKNKNIKIENKIKISKEIKLVKREKLKFRLKDKILKIKT